MPTLPPTIFFASGFNLLRSIDDGQHWPPVLPVTGDGGYDAVREQALLVVGPEVRRSRYGDGWDILSHSHFAEPAIVGSLDIVNDGHYFLSGDLNIFDATATPDPNMAISSDGGLTWRYTNPGPYCRIAFGVTYAAGYYYTAQDFAGGSPPPPSGPTTDYGFFRSADGISWARRTNPTIPSAKPNGAAVIGSYLQNSAAPQASPTTGALLSVLNLFGGTGGGFAGTVLVRSTDGMATWTPLWPPDGTGTGVVDVVVCLPSGRWVATIFTSWDYDTITPGPVGIYYSDDDGDTWTAASIPPAISLGEFSVRMLRVGHDGAVYVVLGDSVTNAHVWQSDDGAAWAALGRLPVVYGVDLFTMPGFGRGVHLGEQSSAAHFLPNA